MWKIHVCLIVLDFQKDFDNFPNENLPKIINVVTWYKIFSQINIVKYSY